MTSQIDLLKNYEFSCSGDEEYKRTADVMAMCMGLEGSTRRDAVRRFTKELRKLQYDVINGAEDKRITEIYPLPIFRGLENQTFTWSMRTDSDETYIMLLSKMTTSGKIYEEQLHEWIGDVFEFQMKETRSFGYEMEQRHRLIVETFQKFRRAIDYFHSLEDEMKSIGYEAVSPIAYERKFSAAGKLAKSRVYWTGSDQVMYVMRIEREVFFNKMRCMKYVDSGIIDFDVEKMIENHENPFLELAVAMETDGLDKLEKSFETSRAELVMQMNQNLRDKIIVGGDECSTN